MTADWIAVDWGTSNLRAWAMAGGQIIAEGGSDDGAGRLKPDAFEAALLAVIGDWLPPGRTTRVIACGMVGSRQGWIEAPYAAVPCAPVQPGALVPVVARDPRLALSVIPGLSQTRPGADVMRGEETQIAGVLRLNPGFDGVICLPGTHSKWAHVSAGEVVSFQTFMTGELFALLSSQSVLRHGIGAGWDDVAFDAGVSDALSHPERIGARLFALRAEGLLSGLSPDAARARLSGLLVGMELAAARPYWLGQDVAIVGSAGLAKSYTRALAAQGASPRALNGTECTLAGLAAALGKDIA